MEPECAILLFNGHDCRNRQNQATFWKRPTKKSHPLGSSLPPKPLPRTSAMLTLVLLLVLSNFFLFVNLLSSVCLFLFSLAVEVVVGTAGNEESGCIHSAVLLHMTGSGIAGHIVAFRGCVRLQSRHVMNAWAERAKAGQWINSGCLD